MLSSEALGQIRQLAQEVSQREGCILYDLEFVGRGLGQVLRVFIDSEQGGVSIDQCANVSRGLSLRLDIEDVIPGEARYELEVSSPGLERPLREPWHFERALGQTVLVKTRDALVAEGEAADRKSKRKQIKGSLVSCDEQGLLLEAEGKNWPIKFDQLHKANLVFEEQDKWAAAKKPIKKKTKKLKN